MAIELKSRQRSTGRLLLLVAAALCLFQSTVTKQPLAAAQAPAPKSKGGLAKMVEDHSRLVAAAVLVLCLAVGSTEPKTVPPSIGGPLEKRGDFPSVLFINALLSLCSGMMNALAFLECSATIAHHSGNLTHWGRNWGIDSVRFGCYLLAFMVGGVMIGGFKADTESIFVGRYSPSMLAAVLASAAGTMIQLCSQDALATLVLWSLAQGIQNGLCRKFSSMPLCSTHFTGYLTDAGNLTGAWVRAKVYKEPAVPTEKPILFYSCMVAFAAGGFAAKIGRDSHGIIVAMVPTVLMASVALGIYPLAAPKGKK